MNKSCKKVARKVAKNIGISMISLATVLGGGNSAVASGNLNSTSSIGYTVNNQITFQDPGFEKAVRDSLKMIGVNIDPKTKLTKADVDKVGYLKISGNHKISKDAFKQDLHKVANLAILEVRDNKTIKNFDGVKLPYSLRSVNFDFCAIEDISEFFKYNIYGALTFEDCPNLDVDYNEFCKWRRESVRDSVATGETLIEFEHTKFDKKLNRPVKFKNPIDEKIVAAALGLKQVKASDLISVDVINLDEKYFTSEEQKYQVINRLVNETPEIAQAIGLRKVKTDLDTLISKGIVKPDSLNQVVIQNTQAPRQTYVLNEADSMKGLKVKFQNLNTYGIISDKNEEIIMQAICQKEAKKCFEAIKKENSSEVLRGLAAVTMAEHYKYSWLRELVYLDTYYTQAQVKEATALADKYFMKNAVKFFEMAGIKVINSTDKEITFICDGKEGSFQLEDTKFNYPDLTESDIDMTLKPKYVNKHTAKYFENYFDRLSMINSRHDKIYEPEILKVQKYNGSENKPTIEEAKQYYRRKLEEAKSGMDKFSEAYTNKDMVFAMDYDIPVFEIPLEIEVALDDLEQEVEATA